MTWTGKKRENRARERIREKKKEHHIILNEYRNTRCSTQTYYTYTIIREAQHEKVIPKKSENNKIDTYRTHWSEKEKKAYTYALIQ